MYNRGMKNDLNTIIEELEIIGDILEDLNKLRCSECGSLRTYISPNGYDTVMVCEDCHSEEHIAQPYTQEDAIRDFCIDPKD